MHKISSEDPTTYGPDINGTGVDGADVDDDNEVIRRALRILAKRLHNPQKDHSFVDPYAASAYLTLRLSGYPDEHFAVMFLDNRHRLIRYEELFTGTIDGASVYPRVVVRRALELNAAAVILAHNHPSGVTDPSRPDELITARLKDALALVDVRVLDHIILGEGDSCSMAARGML